MFKIRSRKPTPAKTMHEEICRAIAEQCLIECVYIEGEKRSVEPHCHGHGRAGQEILSAYQIAGPTEPGWKMFEVESLIDVLITETKFTPRIDFNPENPGMSQIHCRMGK